MTNSAAKKSGVPKETQEETETQGRKENHGGRPPRRGRPSVKREVILEGARTVFGRDGYARASIDAIAAEAGVSTRTLYNHFAGKEKLFAAVIEGSAAQVRDAQLDLLERHFGAVEADLEPGLVALGMQWVGVVDEFAGHFAMVRHINADAQHIPAALLDTWRRTGPEPVQTALGQRFGELAERGVLRVPDPLRAAGHFTQLIAGEINSRTFYGALPLAEDEVERIVTDGVRAFLYGYAA